MWFAGATGRYLEIRARFAGTLPGQTFATPTLCGVKVSSAIADANCDGVVNTFDIDPFTTAIADPAAYAAAYPNCNIVAADVNCDGLINVFDVDPFVTCLSTGESCCQASNWGSQANLVARLAGAGDEARRLFRASVGRPRR